MKKKRVVVAADFHAGHEYGIVPPGTERRSESSKMGRFEKALWDFYTTALDSVKPIDVLIVPGDCIEGKGERSGGMELITADRNRQAQMAARAIDYAEAEKVRIFRGTRAHVGKDEDWEDVILKASECKDISISDHDWLECNGQIIDVRHKVGGSTVPHGRHTPIARERLWNLIWNSEGQRQPKASIVLRAHVHYFSFCGASTWLGITCPALCYNSSFGKRECSGVVDVGILVFDFEEDGSYSWRPILADFPALKVRRERV